jgi:hypothetical protein
LIKRLCALPDEEGGQPGDGLLTVSPDDVQLVRDSLEVGELENDMEGAEVMSEQAERIDLRHVAHNRDDAADVRRVPVLEGEVRRREEDSPPGTGEEPVLSRLGALQVDHDPTQEDGPVVYRQVPLRPGRKTQEHGTTRGGHHDHLSED